MTCGLHAMLLNQMKEIKIKRNRQHSMWVAHCVVKLNKGNKKKKN